MQSVGDGPAAPCSGALCTTLRDALETANALPAVNNITFAGGLTGDIVLTAGQLTISNDLTITGPGAMLLRISGNQANRVLSITSGHVFISGLSIVAGNEPAGSGGGLENMGNLTLSNVAIYDNTADLGGGIASTGALTLTASAIYTNTAFNGGGVNVGLGTAVIRNSTISDNMAQNSGGGLVVAGGSHVTLNNVTIADNDTSIDFGGENKTGGIQLSFGTVIIQNSIVAGNRSQGDATALTADCNSSLDSHSQGYNVTGTDTGCLLSQIGDQTIPPGDVFVTMLGSLQDNGGSTWTHALLAGSLPLEAGNPIPGSCEPTDQRGVSRPQGVACDSGAYEREGGWLMSHPHPLHLVAPVVERPWAAGSSSFWGDGVDIVLPLDTAVITPTYGALFDTFTPIEISGYAYAEAYVRQVTLLANGEEIYTVTYTEQEQLTEVPWATTFTPPSDGTYILVALVADWVGNEQIVARPIEIMVATGAPSIGITTEAITTLFAEGVPAELVGTATAPGRAQVAVQVGAGEPFRPASYHDGFWRFGWQVDPLLDGAAITVTARLTDTLGRVAETNRAVVVDVVRPEMVSTAVQYRDQNGIQYDLQPGETVRAIQPTLILTWTASTDGSGLAQYLVGFTTEADPDPALLTSISDAATRYLEFAPAEAQTYYAHIISVDAHGNETAQTSGPFFVDAPTTPDLITPLGYRDWTESGATLIATDGRLGQMSGQPAQSFFASWQEEALRLAWLGSNWEGSDLFIYLDGENGGGTTLYNPYGVGPMIGLPDDFGADYLVWIQDSHTAELYQWQGDGWTLVQTLGAAHFQTDGGVRSDLLLPFAWLGLEAGAALKLVAIAAEEGERGDGEGGLVLWATAPAQNPLNSPRLWGVARAEALGDFRLTQFYLLDGLLDGVRPDGGELIGGDVRASLSSASGSIAVGFLHDGLFDRLTPHGRVDSNNDGQPDMPLPIALNVVPVGDGAIHYTLHYHNQGAQTAENVQATARAYGALRFPDGSDTAVFNLGDVGAGISNTLQIEGVINNALNGQTAELVVTLSDAVHGEFDWLWALNPVDSAPPQGLTITTNGGYARPGINIFSGLVHDPAGVAQVTLDVGGQLVTCPVAEPFVGSWRCAVALGQPQETEAVVVRARAVDVYGHWSQWSDPVNVIVDGTMPTVALDPEMEAYVADGWLGPAEMVWQGTLADDVAVRALLVCPEVGGRELCTAVSVWPSGMATGRWQVDLAGWLAGDGLPTTLTLYAQDEAGNLSAPLSRTFGVDTVRPVLTVGGDMAAQVYSGEPVVIGGTLHDGGGVSGFTAVRITPNGEQMIEPVSSPGAAWRHTLTFGEAGQYIVYWEARDYAGNRRAAGPFVVTVLPPREEPIHHLYLPLVFRR